MTRKRKIRKKKKCNRCWCVKRLTEFPRSGKYYKNQCKSCLAIYQRGWRARSEVRARLVEKRTTPGYRAQRRAAAKRQYLAVMGSSVRSEKRRSYFRKYFRNKYAHDEEYRWKKLNPVKKRDTREYEKMRRVRDAKKLAARKQVRYAVKTGTLVKLGRCEECGKKGETTAHHVDYDDALFVAWLCSRCHGAHRRIP